MGHSANDSIISYELSSGDDSTLEPLIPFEDELKSPSLKRFPRHLPVPNRIPVPVQNTAFLILGFLIAGVVFFFTVGYRHSDHPAFVPDEDIILSPAELTLLGPPTLSFRENLRDDTNYITTWADSGWTNDVMTYMNMIYLAIITDRVPVIPPFRPSHVGGSAGYIDFATIFDLPRLVAELNIPILEWNQVKAPESEVIDQIGCWTLWSTVRKNEQPWRGHDMTIKLGLDVSYTAVPDRIRLHKDLPQDLHMGFWGLASLTFPEGYAGAMVHPPHNWPGQNHSSPPDQHLVCYDLAYYIAAYDDYEYERVYSPAWRWVGRHTHWHQDLKELANTMLSHTFGLSIDDDIPPYIGIHIRHGDFKASCKDIPKEECFAPLTAYARRVSEIQSALIAQAHPAVTSYISSAQSTSDPQVPISLPVVVTSDERDPEWWDEIRALGWTWVDHSPEGEDTEAIYGKWYPALLDAVFQSSGVGFVGTAGSTMSLLAKRRVEDWADGIGVMVKWGHKDADAH